MFKTREHESATSEANSTETIDAEDDDSIPEPGGLSRKLAVADQSLGWYETDLTADQRLKSRPEDAIIIKPTKPNTIDKLAETKDFWMDQSSDHLDDISTVAPPKDDTSEPDMTHSQDWHDIGVNAGQQKSALNDELLDPSAPDKAKIAAVAKTQDFWMEEAAPSAPSTAKKVATKEYMPDLLVDKHLKSRNPHKPGTEDYISYNEMMQEEQKLEAALRNPNYVDHMSLGGIKDEIHYDSEKDKYEDTVEMLSLEDMIQEEHKLESVLQKQENKMEKKASVISNLRKEELHYESEIERLERLLSDMALAPGDIEEDIDGTEF